MNYLPVGFMTWGPNIRSPVCFRTDLQKEKSWISNKLISFLVNNHFKIWLIDVSLRIVNFLDNFMHQKYKTSVFNYKYCN